MLLWRFSFFCWPLALAMTCPHSQLYALYIEWWWRQPFGLISSSPGTFLETHQHQYSFPGFPEGFCRFLHSISLHFLLKTIGKISTLGILHNSDVTHLFFFPLSSQTGERFWAAALSLTASLIDLKDGCVLTQHFHLQFKTVNVISSTSMLFGFLI